MNIPEKLPRGHAYIRMRNKGVRVHIDYVDIDHEQAERMWEAVMAIFRADQEAYDREHPRPVMEAE